MPISQTGQLFSLVKSLTKSEKRNFRLYVNRLSEGNATLYVQLFDLLDKQAVLDEAEIFERIAGLNRGQYSNLKRHLYSQIMVSLEQLHKQKRADIKIRELLNYAHILYGKGLYLQSLKILQKAKTTADRHHYDLHYLSILEFEKKIQSRHITRMGAAHSLALVEESEERAEQITSTLSLSNLRLRMHNYYIKHGHVGNAAEAQGVARLFEAHLLPGLDEHALGVKERAYLYQSYVWYHFILLDFAACFRYAEKWVRLFKEHPNMALRDPDLFMRGYHYLLTSAYNIRDRERHTPYLAEAEQFRKGSYKRFNKSSQIMSFIYVHNARLNDYMLRGDFAAGVAAVHRTLDRIKRYGDRLDPHRVMILYYKIAWLYLGAGDPGTCVEYLQQIVGMNTQNLRSDVQIFTHLLFLPAHYDLGNENIIFYVVKNAEVFLDRQTGTHRMPRLCLQFFKRIVAVPSAERRAAFEAFERELLEIRAAPYEQRAFFYLDMPSWVRAKIERRGLAAVIKAQGVDRS